MKLFALTMAGVLMFAEAGHAQMTVEEAQRMLEVSFTADDRGPALAFLAKQKNLPPSLGPALGRIILTVGETNRNEARQAMELLAKLGDASFPIIVKLLQNGGFEVWAYATGVIRRLENPDEKAFIQAMHPLLEKFPTDERFPGIFALGAFPLSSDTATSLSRENLRSASALETALLISRHSKDPELFREMQKARSAIVRYAGAAYAERLLTPPQDWMLSHVPQPIPPEEVARRKEVADRLRPLALEAAKEWLMFIRNPSHGRETYLLLSSLELISGPLVESEIPAMVAALRARLQFYREGRDLNSSLYFHDLIRYHLMELEKQQRKLEKN
ncbi:MAG: hypothetical protein K8R23_12705 [Chthoniobacter sp.]|nr:hypothetical protein [Chthoniobacter sp.]